MNSDAINYRAFVGPEKFYYQHGQARFKSLLDNGLCESSFLLDIGCGSLRVGRLLIPFLLPGRYYGVEPQKDWLQEGLREEVEEVFGPRDRNRPGGRRRRPCP